MKKVLLGLFALSCVSLAAETNLYLRAGGDIWGEFDVIKDSEFPDDPDMNDKDTDDFGWEIMFEATKEIYPNLELGFGIGYQDHGKPKSHTYVDPEYTIEFEMPDYTSIPLYMTAKYNFNSINNFTPYLKANLGYSFNDNDGDIDYYDTQDGKGKIKFEVDDGLYCGIGGGFEYNNFIVDLMYQLNKTDGEVKIEEDKFDGDYDYSRVTLSFGYKFDLNF